MKNLYSFSDFVSYAESQLNPFVEQVCHNVRTRIPTPAEIAAMRQSYPVVSEMLAQAMAHNPALAGASVCLAYTLFEYKLPSAPAWCDLVLLGEGGGQKQALIIELKSWFGNETDTPGPYRGTMTIHGETREHPSDQVRGYMLYCKNFHSAVLENNANVSGCAFLTRPVDLDPYLVAPNDTIASECPIFDQSKINDLANFVCGKIDKGNDEWATSFVNGYYKQNRNIIAQIAETMKGNSTSRPFILLGDQNVGYQCVSELVKDAVADKNKKQVIVVSGPPGSGKSAIALNLWVDSVREYVSKAKGDGPGNVVFVSTSSAQDNNWCSVFEKCSGDDTAGGIVMRSNKFNPGMTGGSMKKEYLPVFKKRDAKKYLRDEKSLKYEYFEDYLQYMIENGKTKDYCDNLHFMSIVDEAHALINPLASGFSVNNMGGWCMQMGPQVYHIIRESRVSVFFMDGEQSYRDNESTQYQDIVRWAQKLGADVTTISLAGMQFRCAGSAEYVDWVQCLLSMVPKKNTSLWRDIFKFGVYDSTVELEKELRAKQQGGDTVRLLSSYSVDWLSARKLDRMHAKSDVPYDFEFQNEDGNWFKRHWNYADVSGGYDVFVQAPEHTRMHDDPLCEVGCPYVMRGFDVDYVGLLWLDDLVWRSGKWMVNLDCAKESANACSRSAARKEQEAILRKMGKRGAAAKDVHLVPCGDASMPYTNAFCKTVLQAYRILLTRAVKGMYVYIRDKETREHVIDTLGGL